MSHDNGVVADETAIGIGRPMLVECVPNVSEGRNQAVIDQLAAAIRAVPGVHLLHVHPGRAAHRTVFSFAGEAEDVLEAAYALVAASASLIDLRHHRGIHPRVGAADVVPFVPLSGPDGRPEGGVLTGRPSAEALAACANLARRLGERVASTLSVPVTLYGAAARMPHRAGLRSIRRGGFEGLADRLADPKWAPDFGTAPHPTAGLTVTGARDVLVAYNIDLATRDVSLATRIAERIRTSGGVWHRDDGSPARAPDGTILRQPGLFRSLQALGWLVEDYGCAQVSTNILDWRETPPYAVFDAVDMIAQELGTSVTGSELIGLAPEGALVESARLGLGAHGPFDLDERTLERALGARLA